MHIVIEADDFKQLSPSTRQELLRHFAGAEWAARAPGQREATASRTPVEPRCPLVDLNVDQAAELVSGLAAEHRRRLQLFAQRGGRVQMSELQATPIGHPQPGLPEFLRAVTGQLREVLDDRPDAQIIGWDPDAVQLDEQRLDTVDGVYFVSDATAHSLRTFFPCF